MTSLQFILRGLKHHRAGYLGVLLGSALGTMVLLGALFAGDSVKSTLLRIAEQRTGKTKLILAGGENLFRSQLAADLSDTAAPVLQLRGQVSEPSGRSTGQVDFFGIDSRFWSFAPEAMADPQLSKSEWAINRQLADTLKLEPGQSIILRLRQPGLVAGDAPLSENDDELITLRGKIGHILSDSEMGRFGLQATQLPASKVFLPIDTLAAAIEHPDRANLILARDTTDLEGFQSRIKDEVQLADYGLSIKNVPESGALEIRTERIFLSPTIESRIEEAFPHSTKPTLTYLVNTLAANDRETPYSMVTGADPTLAPFLPNDLKDNEIALSSWEAEDLAAEPGDSVRVSYYVLDKNNLLTENHAEFVVRSIYPLEGAAADKLWTPDFPGIAEAETNAGWESGLPLDTTRIRDKDETYWDDHRATPKAFITHRAAAKLWENRWGSATALRSAVWDISQQQLEKGILAALSPADAGFHLQDIATESQRAASSPVDIASLFLSMSFFLIIAAVALTAMLFRFNVEQRGAESGLLSAVGIPAKTILRWRLAEGFVIVTLGALLGAALAFAYTRGLLLFLEQIWNTNSGGERLFDFHASPASVAGGIVGFVIIMMATIWLVTRKQSKRSASLRLTSGSEEIPPTNRRKRPRLIAITSGLVALASLAASSALGPSTAFFLTGFALLIFGLSVWRTSLQAASHAEHEGQSLGDEGPTPTNLAKTNLSRRPTRSLVAIGTLASAIFLVISVTAFQKHGTGNWQDTSSGTGGYGLWIETSNPLTRLNKGKSAGKFEFQDDTIQQLLPIRVGSGDDASCFNLNSVAQPRLLATDTAALEEQNAFTIKSTADGIEPTWSSLRDGDQLRAFIDETTLMWVLKKKPGDVIEYTDELGNPFEVLIAGTLTESVFQGSFIVDEQAFLKHFPSSPGYRLFLAAPAEDPDAARIELQKNLTDLGATITPTADRLSAFHSVENTYISIFNVLGGLGVILGAAGLGLVTARNLAERKEELAMLHTIGISKKTTRSLIIKEVRKLIIAALLIGFLAALVSILPSLPQQPSPVTTLVWISGLAILTTACASLSAWIAYRFVGRSDTPF